MTRHPSLADLLTPPDCYEQQRLAVFNAIVTTYGANRAQRKALERMTLVQLMRVRWDLRQFFGY